MCCCGGRRRYDKLCVRWAAVVWRRAQVGAPGRPAVNNVLINVGGGFSCKAGVYREWSYPTLGRLGLHSHIICLGEEDGTVLFLILTRSFL